MDCKELKNYTNRAKELEAAIYTQEKLMAEHKKIIDENHPIPPETRRLKSPMQPIPQQFEYKEPPNEELAMWILALMLMGAGCFFLFQMLEDIIWGIIFGIGYFVVLLSVVMIVAGPIILFGFYRNRAKKKKEADLRYNQKMEDYDKNMARYFAEVDKETVRYNAEKEKYNVALSAYTASSTKAMQQHEAILLSLKKALDDHYAQNVVFPKYRNFVAITSISEYLMSGRCDRLEGANGAYNLYEMELRQNIIIGQLSAVIDNLEQIRNDQYSLYQELCKTNELVTSIAYDLRELNDNSKLTAYYSYVSALAAVSPTYSFGIVY